jgi:hypothetical protein
MAAWASLFLEYWKRQEIVTALRWGMTGFEETESERPAFEGTVVKSPIDGKPTRYYSPWKRWRKSVNSYLVVLSSVGTVIGMNALIFFIRDEMSRRNIDVGLSPTGTIVTSLMLAALIQVMPQCSSLNPSTLLDIKYSTVPQYSLRKFSNQTY